MNERIKELAKQTGYIWHASGDPQIYEFTPEKLEKFAELIVRECAKRVDYWESRQGEHADDLLKHFGVEDV
jgi:cytochrome P450